jgi:hypothetical protein
MGAALLLVGKKAGAATAPTNFTPTYFALEEYYFHKNWKRSQSEAKYNTQSFSMSTRLYAAMQ